MEYLSLKDNLLATLPKSIGSLVVLRELDLKANEILQLPQNFSNLKKLEKLNIAFNFKIDVKNTANILSSISSLKIVDISDAYFDKETVSMLRSKMPNTTFKAFNIVKK